MNTYKLFSEHLEKTIYGKTEEDALSHCGRIETKGTYDARAERYTPGPKWKIKHLMGRENNENSTRGGYKYTTIIAAVEMEGEQGIIYRGIDVRMERRGAVSQTEEKGENE